MRHYSISPRSARYWFGEPTNELETAADARRIAQLSRASTMGWSPIWRRCRPEGWTEQCAESSGRCTRPSRTSDADGIHGGMIRWACAASAMTQEDRLAIWGRFDAMAPRKSSRPSAQQRAFIALVDSFSEAELGASMPWLGGSSAPVASVLASASTSRCSTPGTSSKCVMHRSR